MASENGQEKREMLADIVAEIRAYGAQPPPRLMWLEIADRIEAAWKREKAEAEDNALAVGGVVEAARHSPGNAAAMREALVKIYTCVDDCDNYDPESKLDEVIGIADAALSAPPRNCDEIDLPTDCNLQKIHISDRVHMLITDCHGDHEWDDEVCSLEYVGEGGGDLWLIHGKDGVAWACECEVLAPAAEKGENDGSK